MPGRGRERPVAALARVGEQLVERGVEPDLAELDARLVGLEPGGGARELDHADRPLAALEEAQGALDLGGPERVPASAQADERLLRGGELGELLGGQLDVPDREPPVERRDRLAGQDAARRRRPGSSRRG